MTIAFAELPPATVNARFNSARRNGQATWLWPDVDIEDWRKALAEIGRVARGILAGDATVTFSYGGAAAAASVAGYTSGMGPLLGFWIETGVLAASPVIADVFALHLAHNRDRMSMLSRTAKDVVGKLADAGINPLVIKGMHTAFGYFPEPGARAVSDIDLVIAMEAMPTAEEVFSALGYRRIPRFGSPYACDWVWPAARSEPRTLMYVHRDDPWSLDVQASLNRRLLTGVQVRLDALYRASATDAWPLSPNARVLSQPLLTLQLAAHISQVLVNITLARVVELIFVIRADTAAGRLRWPDVLDGARAIGGGRFIYPALAFCEQLAPGTVPAHVLDDCTADAPRNLRRLVAELSVDQAQSLGRHSIRGRFMWAGSWIESLQQIAGEFALDGRRQPFHRTLHSIGTKLWALWRGRYTV
jgi:Uncharacterised nucleotidyltransferase